MLSDSQTQDKLFFFKDIYILKFNFILMLSFIFSNYGLSLCYVQVTSYMLVTPLCIRGFHFGVTQLLMQISNSCTFPYQRRSCKSKPDKGDFCANLWVFN